MNSNKNLTISYNHQSTPVQVIYFIKNKIIFTKQFLLSSTFNSVLDYFKNNTKPESNIKLKDEYIYKNKTIDLNEPLINLIELKKNSSSSTIESVEIYIELEYQNKTQFSQIFNILIQPKQNPFGLYVFNSNEGSICLEQYPEKIIKKYELDKYSLNYSAYCNSPKHLYISGGKINTNSPLNDFWIINNKKYSIVNKKMPYKKSNHSMLYVYLNNKEYIFIAGGDSNLITFYYDINMKSFVIWSNMNSINIKPSLYQYNQYIYSFNSFNKSTNSIFFERTNLVTGKPCWEKIIPKYNNNILSNFKSKNFGISKGTNNDIIFLGGEDADNKIVIYNPEKNELCLNQENKNVKIKLSDKNFYCINKEHYISLPSTISIKKEIAVFNIIKQNIRLMAFEISKGKSNIKLKNDLINEKKEKTVGNIFVNAKIHERLRFDIQPEIVEVQKLSYEMKCDITNEKEIIKMEYNPELSKEEIFNKNKRKENKKNIFYLSDDIVYNNFVNLVVKKIKKNLNVK